MQRRDFLKTAGITASALTLPWASALEAQQRLARRPIGDSGESLPVIGLGNGRAFLDGDVAAARGVMEVLREHGGSYMDCIFRARNTVAQVVGDLNAPDDFFIGAYVMGETDQDSRAEIAELIEISGKESLDLVHAWNEYAVPNWDRIRGWKEDGLARYIGVSRNTSAAFDDIMQLMRTRTVDIAQVNYSALETEAEERVLPMALDMGVAVTVNRAFLNGEYFSLVAGHELPAWAADFDCESWAQLALKFVLSHPAVTCVIAETSNPEHAIDNIGAGFGRMPDDDQRAQIRAHLEGLSA